MFFKRSLIFIVLFLVIITRFIGLNWGNGYFFHPDENNMASAVSRLKPDNLDPDFYAYGQFPLYLSYFSLRLLSLPNTFSHAVLALRFYSAVFSVISVYIIFLLSRKIFSPNLVFYPVLLTIFNPGLIQMAHFGTTESLLILVFLVNIFLAFKILDQPQKYSYYIFAGIINGIGLATKISSLIFLGPIFLTTLINLIKHHQFKASVLKLFILAIFTIEIYLLASPYNFISQTNFLSTMTYETNVALGHTKVFYTTQFSQTTPYLFQIIHVFPYTSGIFQFFFAIFGFLILIKNWQLKNKTYSSWFLILFSSLIYFLYFGQLYVKWTRFVSPIFFLFPLLSVVFISLFKNHKIRLLFLFLGCLPGIYFFYQLYFHPDIRLTVSLWLNKNIPAESRVLSEGGNVIDIPLTNHSFPVTNYDFYQYQPNTLIDEVVRANYIFVPSRRVFANYDYPYHRHLFNGSLGFKEIKTFIINPDIFLNSENAEETWSVFDHPVIRIFRKENQLDLSQYEKLI